MSRLTPQQVRQHLLKHLHEQGPATITQLSYGLSSLVSTLATLGLAYVVYRDRFEGSI